MHPAGLDEMLGEVIEATNTEFVAESKDLHAPPAFGDFVRIPPPGAAADVSDPFAPPRPPDGTIYGLVMEARTVSREPNRRAASFGLSDEDLRRHQPQIWELLVTDFVGLLIGYAEGGEIRSNLPPRPPRLHAFVEKCPADEVCALTRGFAYLRTIASAPGCRSCDELMAASLREAHRCSGKDTEFLVRAGRELAVLLRDDYERLAAILRKLQ